MAFAMSFGFTVGFFAVFMAFVVGAVTVRLMQHFHLFPGMALAGNTGEEQAGGSEQEGSFHLGRGCSAWGSDGKREGAGLPGWRSLFCSSEHLFLLVRRHSA